MTQKAEFLVILCKEKVEFEHSSYAKMYTAHLTDAKELLRELTLFRMKDLQWNFYLSHDHASKGFCSVESLDAFLTKARITIQLTSSVCYFYSILLFPHSFLKRSFLGLHTLRNDSISLYLSLQISALTGVRYMRS